MKILVTGVSGYIGNEVAKTFSNAGHQVYGHLRNHRNEKILWQNEIQPLVSPLESLSKEFDAIICCSGGDAESNLQTVHSLLSLDPKIFVYTSGVWVYGNRSEPVDENTSLQPLGLVKWRPNVENIALQHPKSIVIRPAHVYGFGRGLIGALFESGKKNALEIIGDGNNFWPVIHLSDLARLYLLAVESKLSQVVFNAAEEDSIQMKDLAQAISKMTKAQPHYLPLQKALQQIGPLAEGLGINQVQISSKKAKQLLNWEPRHPKLLDEIEHYYQTWLAFQ